MDENQGLQQQHVLFLGVHVLERKRDVQIVVPEKTVKISMVNDHLFQQLDEANLMMNKGTHSGESWEGSNVRIR